MPSEPHWHAPWSRSIIRSPRLQSWKVSTRSSLGSRGNAAAITQHSEGTSGKYHWHDLAGSEGCRGRRAQEARGPPSQGCWGHRRTAAAGLLRAQQLSEPARCAHSAHARPRPVLLPHHGDRQAHAPKVYCPCPPTPALLVVPDRSRDTGLQDWMHQDGPGARTAGTGCARSSWSAPRASWGGPAAPWPLMLAAWRPALRPSPPPAGLRHRPPGHASPRTHAQQAAGAAHLVPGRAQGASSGQGAPGWLPLPGGAPCSAAPRRPPLLAPPPAGAAPPTLSATPAAPPLATSLLFSSPGWSPPLPGPVSFSAPPPPRRSPRLPGPVSCYPLFSAALRRAPRECRGGGSAGDRGRGDTNTGPPAFRNLRGGGGGGGYGTPDRVTPGRVTPDRVTLDRVTLGRVTPGPTRGPVQGWQRCHCVERHTKKNR